MTTDRDYWLSNPQEDENRPSRDYWPDWMSFKDWLSYVQDVETWQEVREIIEGQTISGPDDWWEELEKEWNEWYTRN